MLRLAKNYNEITEDSSYEEVCNDPGLVNEVLRILALHGKKNGLEKFEIPTKLTLIETPWTAEMGLVTAAFKLKRKEIQKAYQEDIDRMYNVTK